MGTKLTLKRIKLAQALLIIAGYDKKGQLVTNGRMDEETRNALRAFQRALGLETTGELDEGTLHEMDGKFFEPEKNPKYPVKMVQAAMVICGLDYDGTLFANGRLDEPTRERLPVFIALNSIDHFTFNAMATCDDDEPADCLPADRAETVTVPDLPPKGEGERNRV